MNASSACASPPGDAATARVDDATVSLTTETLNLLRAWLRLFNLELAMAFRGLRWLLVGAIAVPVVALSAWMGLCALLVAAAHLYTGNWLLALLIGAGTQLLALGLLLQQLRRWARDLTLPQSRAALVRAKERFS
ncbi:MAG: hypothetical protein ACYC9P_12245 [Rudaea sp.]